MTATPLVEIRGVRKAFGSFEALRGVDLDIGRGEKVALCLLYTSDAADE